MAIRHPVVPGAIRVILYDHIGFGSSQTHAWDEKRHNSLGGYADDLIDVINGLELNDVIYVGHSMGATIGVLAALRRPELFAQLILVCPSPRFLDDPADNYVGGFDEAAMAELVGGLDRDFGSWAAGVTPLIMSNDDKPELARELRASFCRTDLKVATTVARAAFTSDHRAEYARLSVPTTIISTTEDPIVPASVATWLHSAVPDNVALSINASGHCPHLSSPGPIANAIWRSIRTASPTNDPPASDG